MLPAAGHPSSPAAMTIPDFQAKWRGITLTERAASQSHFTDLCLASSASPLDRRRPHRQLLRLRARRD